MNIAYVSIVPGGISCRFRFIINHYVFIEQNVYIQNINNELKTVTFSCITTKDERDIIHTHEYITKLQICAILHNKLTNI